MSKKTAVENLSASLVLNHLKTTGELDKFYNNILMQLKNTPSYQRLKQVSSMHLKGISPDSSKSISFSEGKMEKKKQINEIGRLALSIDSSMSTIVSENIQKKAGSLINSAIKEIIGEGPLIPEKLPVPHLLSSVNSKDSVNVFLATQTSQLNKITQESKDRKTQKTVLGYKKPVKDQKTIRPVETSRVSKRRTRKPNLKYLNKSFLSNGMHSRVQELLDVQRDLNIINGVKEKKNQIQLKKKSKTEGRIKSV